MNKRPPTTKRSSPRTPTLKRTNPRKATAQNGRPERVAERIREEISSILVDGSLRDPAVRGASLMRVEVTRDLGLAKLYVRQTDVEVSPEQRALFLLGMERILPLLRREMGERVTLMRVPELRVYWDDEHDTRTNMERIFLEIAEERAQQAQAKGGKGEGEL